MLQSQSQLRLGDGLQKSGEVVSSHFAGTLNTREGEAWLDVRSHRYIPAVDETVIGIVSEVHAENYNLDISAPVKAVLPVLSFEGATKHNRPKLAVGSLVHCGVLKTSSTAEPLLTCVDKQGRAGGLGVLTGGYTYQCSTHAAQRLLSSAGGRRWRSWARAWRLSSSSGSTADAGSTRPPPRTRSSSPGRSRRRRAVLEPEWSRAATTCITTS